MVIIDPEPDFAQIGDTMVINNLFPIGLIMGVVWLVIVLVVYGVFKRSPEKSVELLPV